MPGVPLALENGHRLFRFFPDHGGMPVWESFTDNYPFDAVGLHDLGVSVELTDALGAWVQSDRTHQDGWTDTPDGRAWLAQRRPLLDRLRAELPGDIELTEF